MRRWLSCSLWLLAWSVWLWMGVRLHRELPRDVAPPVCRIPNPPIQTRTTHVAGFDGPNRVVVAELTEDAPKTVCIYDTATGLCVARYPAPNLGWQVASYDSVLHHGHWLVIKQGVLDAVDLGDGASYRVNTRDVMEFGVHPTKPLVTFLESYRPSGQRLGVYDLRAHRLVFESRLSMAKGEVDPPFFVPGTDKIVLMTRVNKRPDGDGRTTLSIYTLPSLPSSEVLPETIDVGFTGPRYVTTSHTGRAAYGSKESGAFGVYDFVHRRAVFSRHLEDFESHLLPVGAHVIPPAISADGRTVLGDWPQALWQVDSGEPLWKARSFEVAFPDLVRAAPGCVGARFVVLEQWHQLWSNWLPNFRYRTLAHRDARDGSLLYRVTFLEPIDGKYSADWSLLISDNGSVYRLPPPVNYPLLALCQTILALPLILLGAVLRWRRRLRLRLASASP